jgi:hypothetical protein
MGGPLTVEREPDRRVLGLVAAGMVVEREVCSSLEDQQLGLRQLPDRCRAAPPTTTTSNSGPLGRTRPRLGEPLQGGVVRTDAPRCEQLPGTPHGVWTVTASAIDEPWRQHADPGHDIALPTVHIADTNPPEHVGGG